MECLKCKETLHNCVCHAEEEPMGCPECAALQYKVKALEEENKRLKAKMGFNTSPIRPMRQSGE